MNSMKGGIVFTFLVFMAAILIPLIYDDIFKWYVYILVAGIIVANLVFVISFAIAYHKNKKYKNYKTKHEFLSKFQKTDRLHPIVTICIYYGEDSLKLEQEGVELNMCKVLEELEERGREKGRIEGRVEGAIKIYKKMEASREDTIKNIMEDFSLDKEVADKYV